MTPVVDLAIIEIGLRTFEVGIRLFPTTASLAHVGLGGFHRSLHQQDLRIRLLQGGVGLAPCFGDLRCLENRQNVSLLNPSADIDVSAPEIR